MASPVTGRVRTGSGVGACDCCRLSERCAGASTAASGPFRGVSLVGAALLYFLVPALLALVGAAVAGGDAVRQLIGGGGGLLLGMLVANLGARVHPTLAARERCFEPR